MSALFCVNQWLNTQRFFRDFLNTHLKDEVKRLALQIHRPNLTVLFTTLFCSFTTTEHTFPTPSQALIARSNDISPHQSRPLPQHGKTVPGPASKDP